MNKVKKYILVSWLLIGAGCYTHATPAPQLSDSCSYEIQGSILDVETKQPVPFATVMIKDTQKGVVADEQGKFLLDNLCGQEYDLVFSCVGFKSITHHHDAHHQELVIYMASVASELESVTVEGDAIVGDMQSMAVEKIDRSQLATRTTQSLASAIGEIQGVTFTSAGNNVQLPVIHGLYGNRILIINNGVKHGFQNWGSDHAPEIDIASANNISVLKGAAGVRYGPEALGGVVVVEGNPLELSRKMYGSVASGYQTNGRGYHANAQLGAGYKKFSYHVGGNYAQIGDRRTPDYLLWNTGMTELSANAGFRYHLPQWDFKVYYSYVGQELGLLRPSVARSIDLFAEIVAAEEPILMRDFSYDINEPNQNTAHHLATLEVEWYSNIGKFVLLLSQQINDRQEFDVRRNADRPIIDLTLNTTDNRLEWYHPSVGGLEGTVGLQYFSQNNDNNPGTNVIPFIPNYNNYRFSAFAIESFQKGENTFELGLRLDHELNSVRGREQDQSIFRNEFSFTNFTTSLGFVRNLSASWQLRSNLGSAWRTPNMAELYSFGQHGFKIEYGLWRYEGAESGESGGINTTRILTGDDKNVEAEQSYKWINELSYNKNGNALTLTSYVNYINNFIFDRPSGVGRFFWGPGPTYIIDQSDAFFAGADFTYSRLFTKDLKGTFGTSYLWSRNVERNEPLINQPPININAELAWQTPSFLGLDYSKLTIETGYTFRQFQAPRTISPELLDGEAENGEVEINLESEIFDFKDVPEAYFLAHARWQWKRGNLGGQIEVRNVLNTAYRDYLNQMRLFADELGRNFLFTINYNF
ncbi:MAG: TonB-dependent receptor [Bacteroidota bacterium]